MYFIGLDINISEPEKEKKLKPNVIILEIILQKIRRLSKLLVTKIYPT